MLSTRKWHETVETARFLCSNRRMFCRKIKVKQRFGVDQQTAGWFGSLCFPAVSMFYIRTTCFQIGEGCEQQAPQAMPGSGPRLQSCPPQGLLLGLSGSYHRLALATKFSLETGTGAPDGAGRWPTEEGTSGPHPRAVRAPRWHPMWPA